MSMITTKPRAAFAQDAILSGVNKPSGPIPGSIVLYTGAAPADISIGATGTLLSTCTLIDGSVDAFGLTNTTTLVATGFTATGLFASDPSAAASGTIGYFRLLDHATLPVLQGTVGTTGSGADIEFNTLTVTAGNVVAITAFTSTISGIV